MPQSLPVTNRFMLCASAAPRWLFALPLLAWTCAHADVPGSMHSDLYYFEDDRGIITWSNLRSDARLDVYPPSVYSGVLTYTIAPRPSLRGGTPAAKSNNGPLISPAAGDIGSDAPDETPMDH